MEHRINTIKKVRYVAKDFATGLTDLTLYVRDANGDLFDFGGGQTSLVLTELYNGEYEGSYTPNILGVWQEMITSATNGDKAIRSYRVVADDIASLETHLDTVEGKVDTVEGKVDAVSGKIDAIDTELDSKASQASVDVIDANVDEIKTIVQELDLQVSPGGYFSN